MDHEQLQLQARYRELIQTYQDVRVQDRVMGDDLSRELDLVECTMLDNPPAGCRKGLVLPGEMDTPQGVPPLLSLTIEEAGIEVLSDEEILALIADRDRTPPARYVRGVFNQGKVGSCGAESAVGALRTRRNQDGGDCPMLNPYAVYNTTSGGIDRGSTLRDNLAFLQEFGCPSEAVWPRSHGWRKKPSNAAMDDALNYRIAKDGIVRVRNRREFQTMVLAGHPLYHGYTGHAIFGVDLLDLVRFEYQNSWGASWGNNGRGTLAYERIYWPYGCYAIVAVRGRG